MCITGIKRGFRALAFRSCARYIITIITFAIREFPRFSDNVVPYGALVSGLSPVSLTDGTPPLFRPYVFQFVRTNIAFTSSDA